MCVGMYCVCTTSKGGREREKDMSLREGEIILLLHTTGVGGALGNEDSSKLVIVLAATNYP